ncbi:TetR/AcrR family transcriptional regulator [Amycolatopsis sp. NPDC003865]
MRDTRERILDVALEVLGRNPDAGMGAIASAAGVVRRTVYGHFPSRTDLVLALTHRAVSEIAAVLAEITAAGEAADEAWVGFIAHLWPLAHRYRVLVALRRGEYGEEIHALLGPVEKTLAELVERGQDGKAFGRHLPADVLSEIAFATVFTIADKDLSHGALGVRAASMTSLLMLGVPEARAKFLLDRRP